MEICYSIIFRIYFSYKGLFEDATWLNHGKYIIIYHLNVLE